MDCCLYHPPTGNIPLFLAVDTGGRLARIGFVGERRPFNAHLRADDRDDPGACAHVAAQLDEFFARRRTKFDLQLAPEGTAFQREVWERLLEIPYGETRSYGWLAKLLGKPDASRAVGAANGANPIAIVIPCHRVIGANGVLTGYGGGLSVKARLLELEQGNLFD